MTTEPSKKSKTRRRPRQKNTFAEAPAENVELPEETSHENDGEPKKKKKRKIEETPTDSTGAKISKRQMKRERHAERKAEAEASSQKAVRAQALNYLTLWKHNRAEWKFNKVKQIWLHKHKFDRDAVPDELWKPLVQYFSSASGNIKKSISEDCQKVVREAEEKTNDGPSQVSYERARDLLQSIPS